MKEKPQGSKESEDEQGTLDCPECGVTCSPGCAACPRCGAALAAGEPVEAEQPATVHCPRCEITFAGRPGQHCPRCGRRVGEAEAFPWELAPRWGLEHLRLWWRSSVLLCFRTASAFVQLREDRPALSGGSYLMVNVLIVTTAVMAVLNAAFSGWDMPLREKLTVLVLLVALLCLFLLVLIRLLSWLLVPVLLSLGNKGFYSAEIYQLICYASLPSFIAAAFFILGLAAHEHLAPFSLVPHILYFSSFLAIVWAVRTLAMGIAAYYSA